MILEDHEHRTEIFLVGTAILCLLIGLGVVGYTHFVQPQPTDDTSDSEMVRAAAIEGTLQTGEAEIDRYWGVSVIAVERKLSGSECSGFGDNPSNVEVQDGSDVVLSRAVDDLSPYFNWYIFEPRYAGEDIGSLDKEFYVCLETTFERGENLTNEVYYTDAVTLRDIKEGTADGHELELAVGEFTVVFESFEFDESRPIILKMLD